MARALILSLFAVITLAAQQSTPPPTQAQQRPVFRGGTHFVRVDAYPLQDGKIVERLEAEDFEILEDGKPQKIESFDFIKFDTFTPEAERRDPRTQREGFDLAADPRYRLFTIFVDMAFSNSAGPFEPIPNLPHIQQPLVNFLDRIIGPRDLFALITSRNSVKDLVFAQKTGVTSEQIKELWRASLIDRDDADVVLGGCGADDATLGWLQSRYRADMTYSTLTDLIYQLGSLRQERKNLVFVSNLLPRWRPDQAALDRRGPQLPRVGVSEGRISADNRRTVVSGNPEGCTAEFQRLALMDFEPRYRQLLLDARRENVAFYIITPGGLQAPPDLRSTRAMNAAYEDMKSLADETDGVAVVHTNDLNSGLKKIADDLAAYYVLGYYTTNTKFDGRIRQLKVRFKAGGAPIRARREYRAPTQEEIAKLAASATASPGGRSPAPSGPSPLEAALTILERGARPFAVYGARSANQLTVVTELSAQSIQNGRWKEGADLDIDVGDARGGSIVTARGRIEAGTYAASVRVPLPADATPDRVAVRLRGPGESPADDWLKLPAAAGSLLGDPVTYRAASRVAMRPVAAFEFARNERIRVEWPVRGALDRREVRLLDRGGRPLPVELPLSEDAEKKQLVVEMSLSGLGRGDFLIELTAGAGTVSDRRLLAIRLK